MPRPVGHIRFLFSARVLLNLEEADKIFREKGVAAYTDYMRCRGDYAQDLDAAVGGRRLEKGPLWHFAEAALELNKAAGEPLVEVGIYSKDDSTTARPIFRNLDLNGLGMVEFRMATNGNALTQQDHDTFGTDLLLSRNQNDVQTATDNGIAAATINIPKHGKAYVRDGKPLRLWVDGDAVAFGSSGELFFRTHTLEEYKESEFIEFANTIEPGPFTKVLAKISALNAQFPKGQQPFELSLLTARGGKAAARVCTIAEEHGIVFNGRSYWMGGASKHAALSAHKPDIFFDDQMTHLAEAMEDCATGLVTYAKGSAMYEFQKNQQAKVALQQNVQDVTAPPVVAEEKPVISMPLVPFVTPAPT